jgi:hypothetical protein
MTEYTQADFRRMLLEQFPELREEIDDCDGLLHIEMGVFAQHTQLAKGRADWDTYARCVQLADELWKRPEALLLNALNVSYLEHLDFEGPRGPKAWSLLTPALQRGWRAMMDYLERLARVNKPSKG